MLTPDRTSQRITWRTIREIGAIFLRIGATAFGGPAAHVAMMRHELVERRKWLSEQHFLDLLGATNLIPGPNSSEMSMHIGFLRGGVRGLLAGGLGFLLPGMLITMGLAWMYTTYGTTPAAEWLLYGIKPVIIPLILLALWGLSQEAVKDRLTLLGGLVAIVLYIARVDFVLLLVGIGVVVMLARGVPHMRAWIGHAAIAPLPLIGTLSPAAIATTASGFSLLKMVWAFFKVGALLYGSGYVLFAFLQAEMVERLGWLTEQELIDAIAFGQMTPGPLSTTTTFIGYLLAGVPGAILGTAAFYTPAFVIVGLSHPLIPRIRESTWASGLLDGVNVAALGLMAAVTWELARAAYVDGYTLLVSGIALAALLRWRINSVWLVIFGAGTGLLHALLGGL